MKLDTDIPYTPVRWVICDCGRRFAAMENKFTTCKCGAEVFVDVHLVVSRASEPEPLPATVIGPHVYAEGSALCSNPECRISRATAGLAASCPTVF